MYTTINFKTKKALREAIAEGVPLTIFQPAFGHVPLNGVVFLEGPHYPAMHTWYAQGTMRDGLLVAVK